MKFRTELYWKSSEINLNYQSNLLFLGSCFAENFGRKFDSLKFNTTINPNGIIFHPIPIFEIIKRALKAQPYTASDLVCRDEMYFSWLHHSQHFHENESIFLSTLNEQNANLQNQLKTANYLFLTFGTAWGYELKSSGKIVANCHKIPSINFDKTLSSSTEITNQGIELVQLLEKENPAMKIVFSVSPVRHIKDGIIENSRSKAELISATHQIIEATTNTEYIPAYEWLIDDLRDYRFYGKDNVHPSEEAIEYIWEKLSLTLFEDATLINIQTIQEILNAVNHKPFQVNSKGHQSFLKKIVSKIEAQNSSIQNKLNNELEKLNAQLI
jgi:lysophospholipase L1-like esterase